MTVFIRKDRSIVSSNGLKKKVPIDTQTMVVVIRPEQPSCTMTFTIRRQHVILKSWVFEYNNEHISLHPSGHTDPFAYTVVRGPIGSLLENLVYASLHIENRSIVPFTTIYVAPHKVAATQHVVESLGLQVQPSHK
jgi:hypothetical protein